MFWPDAASPTSSGWKFVEKKKLPSTWNTLSSWTLDNNGHCCCGYSVVSDSLWPHGLQHATLPCPSPTPGACSNSCPSSWWCHPTISSSIIPFSSIALTRHTFVDKVISLLFNMLSRFVIAFLPRSKHLLISWLQSPSAAILEPKKIKSVTVSIVFSSICHEVMGPGAMILVFWMLSFKPAFSLSSSLSSRGSVVPLSFMFTCCSKPVSNITSFMKLSSSLFQTLT